MSDYKATSSQLPLPEGCKEIVRGTIHKVNLAHWIVGGKPSKLKEVTHIISHYMGRECLCYRDHDGLLHVEVSAIKAQQKQPVLTDLRSRIAKGANAGMEKRWKKDHGRCTKYRVAYCQELHKPAPKIEGFTVSSAGTGSKYAWGNVELEKQMPAPIPACVEKWK